MFNKISIAKETIRQFEKYKDYFLNNFAKSIKRLYNHACEKADGIPNDCSGEMKKPGCGKGFVNTPFQLSDLVLKFFKISLACVI